MNRNCFFLIQSTEKLNFGISNMFKIVAQQVVLSNINIYVC